MVAEAQIKAQWMADIKNIFSEGTLFPYTVVTAFVGLAWFFGVRIATMQNQIETLKSNEIRMEQTISSLKAEMITKDIFNAKIETWETKLDQVLSIAKK